MTNGEKFKEIFGVSQVDEGELYAFAWLPNHNAAEFCIDWWNAEYNEPVIRDNGVKNELNRVKNELEPTTKNDVPDNNVGKIAPTAKNDLAVDCVSREKVWYMITNGKYPNEDYEQFIDRLVNELSELPSVTPSIHNSSERIDKCIDKDLAVDCISRQEAIDTIRQLYLDLATQKAVIDLLKILPSVTPQLSSELEKNSKKLEKDFGELDCISRADAIKAMQDKAKKLTNEDTINGLCGAVAILFDLPSVTPIRPKGHWIVREDNTSFVKQIPRRWVECSYCGWSFSYDRIKDDFCSRCGADMRGEE